LRIFIEKLLQGFEGFFDGGAVETDDALAVDFGNRDRLDVGLFSGVHFLIFDILTVEPIHQGVTIDTSRGGIDFNHISSIT